MAYSADLMPRLAQVRLVILDVDGVLTSGKKFYTADGLYALEFDARDGLGIHMLQLAGITVACVSNGKSDIVRRRAADLEIALLVDDVSDKRAAVHELIVTTGVSAEETLYIGDDLWDLPAFGSVGTAVAVADALREAIDAADWVTEHAGGSGAIREVADVILDAQQHSTLALLGLELPHHRSSDD